MYNLPLREPWNLDKKINLPTILAGLSSFIMVISLIASLLIRVDTLEQKARSLDGEMVHGRNIAIAVARMEERINAMHSTLEELRGEMRQLYREQNTKTLAPQNIAQK